jgi:hypothetical protein
MTAAKFLIPTAGLIWPAFVTAETVVWTNGAGDSNWFTAKNWQGESVPGAADHVLIDGASSEAQPVVFNGDTAISRLQMAEHDGAGSDSWLAIKGGSLGTGVTMEHAQIGIRGLGAIRQTGGDVIVPSLVIGRLANGRGSWEISAGTLEVGGQNEGLAIGEGEASEEKPTTGILSIRGNAIVRVARGIGLGGSSSGTGTIEILGPMARLEVGKNMTTFSAEIDVGQEGKGTILMKGGWLDVAALTGAQGLTLRVGNRGNGSGVIQGFGTINTFFKEFRPSLQMGNALVIADGFGTDGTLNLSSYGEVEGAKENSGYFGWYAQNKGRLVLPSLTVKAGAGQTNWGESRNDAEIDLVNSMRLTFDASNTGGRLSVNLLASDHKDVPPGLPPGIVAAVWKIVYPAAKPGLSALQVRYHWQGPGEERLRFVSYDPGTKQWIPCPTVLDIPNRRARAEGALLPGFFALIR